MTSKGFTSSNLIRQTQEARLIVDKRVKVNLMNRKGEWGQNLPLKLTLEDDPNGFQESQQKRQRTENQEDVQEVQDADICSQRRKKQKTCQEPPDSNVEEGQGTTTMEPGTRTPTQATTQKGKQVPKIVKGKGNNRTLDEIWFPPKVQDKPGIIRATISAPVSGSKFGAKV